MLVFIMVVVSTFRNLNSSPCQLIFVKRITDAEASFYLIGNVIIFPQS